MAKIKLDEFDGENLKLKKNGLKINNFNEIDI